MNEPHNSINENWSLPSSYFPPFCIKFFFVSRSLKHMQFMSYHFCPFALSTKLSASSLFAIKSLEIFALQIDIQFFFEFMSRAVLSMNISWVWMNLLKKCWEFVLISDSDIRREVEWRKFLKNIVADEIIKFELLMRIQRV